MYSATQLEASHRRMSCSSACGFSFSSTRYAVRRSTASSNGIMRCSTLVGSLRRHSSCSSSGINASRRSRPMGCICCTARESRNFTSRSCTSVEAAQGYCSRKPEYSSSLSWSSQTSFHTCSASDSGCTSSSAATIWAKW